MKRTTLFASLLLFSTICLYSQSIDNENLTISHGPYLQNLGEDCVTLMWTTNKSALPSVILTDSKGESRTIRNSTDGIIDGGGLIHKVKIDGLSSGTTYTYKPVSVEIVRHQPYKVYFGDTLIRREYSFTTLDKNVNEVRAIIMNDIHEKSYLIGDYMEETEGGDTDMVFYNGDIINHLQEEDQIFKGFLDSSVSVFAREIPFFFIRGNHETRGMLARSFKDYFDFPNDKFYYALTQGPVHFVVLDCGEDKPDDNRYYFNMADYDSYRLEELEWLKEHIKSDEFKDAAFRVVLIHMPVIKKEKMGYGMKFLSEHFGPVLKEANIDLMISGHTHRVDFQSKDKSGFDYPVLVSSNKTFVELRASGSELKTILKDATGKEIMSKEFKR